MSPEEIKRFEEIAMTNKKPTPPPKQVATYLTMELADRVYAAADKADRSVSAWVRRAIQAALKREPDTLQAEEGFLTDVRHFVTREDLDV
jgi:predicted transcriptional regulator